MEIEKLKDTLPVAVMAEIPLVMEKFGITNKLRMAHFLAQCAHESANFTALKENLNYSADGLRKIFPKYFPTIDFATKYARQPEKIANRVYASRMGNGDELSGEGYKFRGRGFIQLTGKSNYQAFSTFIGEDCVANPDLVATKYPLASAAFFFDKNKLWDICDKGDHPDHVLAVTKRVNGGTHGYDDRLAKFKKFNLSLS
jgi:putative chitinase